MDYNKAIADQDLYSEFTSSKEWKTYLKKIRKISPKTAYLLETYGIGTALTDEGNYDFESGQLCSSIPYEETRYVRGFIEAYDSICALANAYAKFVVAIAKE